MTPQLTHEMRQALAEHPGQPLYVVDNTNHQSYVLLPADAYQTIQALLYDDSEPNPDEFMPLAHEAFRADWDAPGMEAYEDFDKRGKAP